MVPRLMVGAAVPPSLQVLAATPMRSMVTFEAFTRSKPRAVLPMAARKVTSAAWLPAA